MTDEQKDLLVQILSDIPEPYQCTVCKALWVTSGSQCSKDCTGTHRDVRMINVADLIKAVRSECDKRYYKLHRKAR